MKRFQSVALLFLLFFSTFLPVLAQEVLLSPEGSPGITIYGQGIALIQEDLLGRIEEGENLLRFGGVSPDILPASVFLKLQRGPQELLVKSQDFLYVPLTYGNIIQMFLGEEITFLFEDGGSKEGQLLTMAPDLLIQFEDHLGVNPPGKIHLKRVPEEMAIQPTIQWKVFSEEGGDYAFQLHYLARGLHWVADYAGFLDSSNTLSLSGWITLQNRSQVDYLASQIQVVAGEVQVMTPQADFLMEDAMMLRSSPHLPAPEKGGEYYVYRIEEPLDLKQGAFQQVNFLQAEVMVDPIFLFPLSMEEGSLLHTLNFTNVEEQGLGVPLPSGTLRVYQDAAHNPLFLGEDKIHHTGVSGEVQLILGGAFDLTGRRRQVEWRQYSRDRYLHQQEIVVENNREDAAVVVVEAEKGRGWEITESSHEYTLYDVNKILFFLTIPPGGREVIEYTRISQ